MSEKHVIVPCICQNKPNLIKAQNACSLSMGHSAILNDSARSTFGASAICHWTPFLGTVGDYFSCFLPDFDY